MLHEHTHQTRLDQSWQCSCILPSKVEHDVSLFFAQHAAASTASEHACLSQRMLPHKLSCRTAAVIALQQC